MTQYIRRVRVSVGQPGQRGRAIEGLRVTFRVERDLGREPNRADLSIYNPAPETIRAFQEPGAVCRLEAGYGDALGVLFLGRVDRAVSTSRGVDVVLQVEAQDGGTRLRGAEITESFSPGTDLRSVYAALARALGLPLGAQAEIPRVSIRRGLVLSGPVADALDLVSRSVGLVWSVQDDEIQIIAGDAESATLASDTGESAPLLSASSGLIGSPSQTDTGVELEVLLDPRIRPGRRFVLQSEALSGVYRCESLEHIGDSWDGQQYYTRIEARVAE